MPVTIRFGDRDATDLDVPTVPARHVAIVDETRSSLMKILVVNKKARLMQPMTIAKTRQIVGIDLVRFFASLIVLLYHLCFWIWAGAPNATTFNAAKGSVQFSELEFFEFGAVGVQIFFVISGFIIAYSAATSTAYEFARSRVVRLMPAIWIIAPITLLFQFFIGYGSTDQLLKGFLRSIVLFPSGPWVDGVYWTLPIEISFYALVFLLLCFDKYKLLSFAIGSIAIASSLFWVVVRISHYQVYVDMNSRLVRLLDLTLINYGCFFAIGVYIWLLFFDRVSPARVVLALCFLIGCMSNISGKLACAVWVGSLIAICVSVRLNNYLLDCRRLTQIARIAGLTTYPLYLLHNIVGAALIGYLVRLEVNKYAALSITISLVIFSATFIATYFEPLLQDGIRSRIDRLRHSAIGRLAAPWSLSARAQQVVVNQKPPSGSLRHIRERMDE